MSWTLTFDTDPPNNVDIAGISNQFEVRRNDHNGNPIGNPIPVEVSLNRESNGLIYTARATNPIAGDSFSDIDTFGLYTTAGYTPISNLGGDARFNSTVLAANTSLTTTADQRFRLFTSIPTESLPRVQLQDITVDNVTTEPDGSTIINWILDFNSNPSGGNNPDFRESIFKTDIVNSMFTTGNADLDAAIANPNNLITLDSVFTNINRDLVTDQFFNGGDVDSICGDISSSIENRPSNNQNLANKFGITMKVPVGYTGIFNLGFKPIDQFPSGVHVRGIATYSSHIAQAGTQFIVSRPCLPRITEPNRLRPARTSQSHAITLTPPILNVYRDREITQEIRRTDTVRWNLFFANSPLDIISDSNENLFVASTQFEARAVYGTQSGNFPSDHKGSFPSGHPLAGDPLANAPRDGTLVPASIIPASPVELTQVRANAEYIATGQITTASTDPSITYALFTIGDISTPTSPTRIGNLQGGVLFYTPMGKLIVADPARPTNLTPDASERYNNLPPLPATLSITRASQGITNRAPEPLVWNLRFGNGAIPISLASPSNQFAVCYDRDNDGATPDETLNLTLTFRSGTTYTATSDPTIPYDTNYEYHICALDGAENIESSTGGAFMVGNSEVTAGRQLTVGVDDNDIADRLNHYDNDPTFISRLRLEQIEAYCRSGPDGTGTGDTTTQWEF